MAFPLTQTEPPLYVGISDDLGNFPEGLTAERRDTNKPANTVVTSLDPYTFVISTKNVKKLELDLPTFLKLTAETINYVKWVTDRLNFGIGGTGLTQVKIKIPKEWRLGDVLIDEQSVPYTFENQWITVQTNIGPEVRTLKVNSYSGTYNEWLKIGDYPYLDKYLDNQIQTLYANQKDGTYGFEDMTDTPASVKLEMFTEGGGVNGKVRVWNGSRWSDLFTLPFSGIKIHSFDLTDFLDDRQKVNSAEILIESGTEDMVIYRVYQAWLRVETPTWKLLTLKFQSDVTLMANYATQIAVISPVALAATYAMLRIIKALIKRS